MVGREVTMSDTSSNGAVITIGSVHVSGAPASISPAQLTQAINTACAHELAPGATSIPQTSRTIPILRLHLPPGAGPSQIAEALARAIRNASEGAHP